MGDPKPIAEPLRRLQEKLGISDEQLAEAAKPEGEAYMAHREFEERHGYRDPTSCEGSLLVEDKSGSVWVAVCDACEFEVGINVGRNDPASLHAHCMERACLPESFVAKAFERTPDQERSLAVARQWVAEYKPGDGRSLPAPALWGSAGRGKSHLLTLVGRSLIDNHLADVRYVAFTELLDALKAEISGGVAEFHETIWQRVLSVDVLVLDDLGAERKTPFSEDRLDVLVDYRYRQEKPIVLATNIPPQAWRKVFGDRTGSRLAGMCLPLRLEGPDRRQLALDEAA